MSYTVSKCFFFITTVQCNCKVVINEINVIDKKKPEKNEFIELKTCDGGFSLRGYKLIGFKCQSKTGTIDLVVTLWNERAKRHGFFMVGGSEVSTADFKLPHDMVKFRNSFTGQSSIMSTFMPNKEIRAFGLLYDSERNIAFNDFVLTKKQPLVKIIENIIDQLKKYLIDLVVYSRDDTCDKCEIDEI